MNLWRLRTLARSCVLVVTVGMTVVACVQDAGAVAKQPPAPSPAVLMLNGTQKASLDQDPSHRSLGLPTVGALPLVDGVSTLTISHEATRVRGALRSSGGTALTTAPPTQEAETPRTHAPLAVQLLAPTDRYVSVRSDVRITFNRPINHGIVERSLQLEPATMGRFEWPDPQTVQFVPEKLAYGTTYRVRLAGVARDDSGGSAWEWTFTTMRALTLSFDDCPWTAAEAQSLLGFLRQNHIRAMMFPTGACTRQYPWLVPTLLADGHRVCNHTLSHAHLMRLPDAGIAAEIRGGVHANCNLLRPPYGEWDGAGGRVERLAAQQGLKIQMWDVDTYDWSEASTPRILGRINDLGGGMILMHFQGRHTQEALRQLDMRDVVNVT